MGAEGYASKVTLSVPLGPLNVSVGGQYGIGGSFNIGYIPGSKKIFGFSISAGLGFDVGVGLN